MFKTRIAVQKKKQKHTHRSNEMQNKINLVSSIKKKKKMILMTSVFYYLRPLETCTSNWVYFNCEETGSLSPTFLPGFSWSRTTGSSRPSARWQGAPILRWLRRVWGPWVWILTGTGCSCSTCWRSTATTPCWCRSSCAAVERRRTAGFSAFHHCWL